MRWSASLVIVVATTAPAAAGDALHKPVSVLSPRVSALRDDPRVNRTGPPPRSSAWERIQDPLDRSMGRIIDQQTYEVSRIERLRDERFGRNEPQRDFDRLQEERERHLRLDEQTRRLRDMDERARRRELDRREYMLYLGGPSIVARQVERDRMALNEAKFERDRELYEAAERLEQSCRVPGADRQQMLQEFERQRREIRNRYERTRQTILGYDQ